MIELADIELTLFGAAAPVHILRGVNLKIDAGERVSIVGPSGSGKSSLLAIMGGIERPTNGSLTVDGMDLVGLSEDQLSMFRRARVGILFQSFHLIPTMTAEENVRLPLDISGGRRKKTAAGHALAEVGLSHRLHHYPSQLSGGEQQRVALARALVSEPGILLADEPTGNLDSQTGRNIMNSLFDVQSRRQMTMVLVTHDRDLAGSCDRQFLMSDGLITESTSMPDMSHADGQ